jgi:hypothetical protein
MYVCILTGSSSHVDRGYSVISIWDCKIIYVIYNVLKYTFDEDVKRLQPNVLSFCVLR